MLQNNNKNGLYNNNKKLLNSSKALKTNKN